VRIVRRHVAIPASPVAPGRPAEILVRDAGEGPAVVLLHGGWGYEAYPFDLAAIAAHHRALAPDRVGYGGSGRLAELPRGFHRAMAEETLLVLDALRIERAAFWGHSDGAVVAAWIGFLAPARVRALVLEALHFLAAKPGSEEFFRTARDAPERFGPRMAEALERDHGARWREVLGAGGRAWLSIIAEGKAGRPDLFEGRFGEIRAPTLLLHGSRDPRTEPGELAAAQRALPAARLALVDAAHCPHASEKVGAEATRLAVEFLEANLT
jgi:3-oxoadipate enol-lactonase